MHFATFLPDWNSLESVRHAHSSLEAGALVFFALLVLFDVLAHLSEDKNKDRARLFEKIGLCFFAVAILAEIGAYPYGQRNDKLSADIIGSLSEKAGQAETKAKKALADSETALTKTGEATTKADAAGASADKAMQKAREAGEYATPRSISDKQAALIRKRIQSLKGHKIVFFGNFNDTEISDFANRLGAILNNGIMDVSAGVWQAGMITPSGMKFGYGKNRKTDFDLIVRVLDKAGVEKADVLRKQSSTAGMPDDWLTITFGAKH
jgi:hypothetical protein